MVNNYRYVFAASTSELPSSGTTVDLGIGQIGVFDGKTYQATNGLTAKSIIIAQGTPDTVFPAGVAKGNQTYKTDPITGATLKSFKRKLAQEGKNMVVTMGYDGADATKNLTVKKGDNFTFWITLYGTPIANLLGDTPKTHSASWTQEFTVILPCVDDCVDTCGEAWDCNIVADAVIEQINLRKIIGGQKLTDYIKVTKVLDCVTPSGAPTVEYTVYHLVIPDTGDQAALGTVQAQYPGVSIKRTKRDGVYSTYEMTILTADGAPADFSSSGVVVPHCDSCPTGCPTGFTLQAAQDVWIVSRPIGEGIDISAIAGTIKTAYDTQTGETATATLLSYNGSTASVKLYYPAGTTLTAIEADSVLLFGTDVAICTQDTPTETAWDACQTCTAGTKQFTLTMLDTCETSVESLVAELEALYGEGNVAFDTNSDTCATKFTITVESNNKDCDACADVLYTFTTPPSFHGLTWTEVVGNVYGTDCVCGIRIESIYEQRKAKECFLNQVAYEYEPLFINISTRNPDPNNFKVLCEGDVPVSVIQNVSYPFGLGRIVADQVIESNYQFNQPWRKNPAERDALEYELGIDLYGYYDQYILTFVTHPEQFGTSHFGTTQTQSFELSVYFKQGTGGDFENVINAFAASNASPVVLEDIGSI